MGRMVLGRRSWFRPDKCIRCPENLRGGAIIFLHQQHPGSGIGALKLHQRIRISGSEAVNALILVAHQKNIPGFPGQEVDDGMLDPGCVLGLVHADIGKSLLKMGQHIGIPLQNGFGIYHLVVIIHPALPAQGLVIPAVQLREFFEPRVQLADFLLVQHHVLCVCNASAQPFRNALGGIFTAELPVQVRNQPGKSALILYQGEGLALSVVLRIEGDDLGGDAVDGAELRNLRAVIPNSREKRCFISRVAARV